MTAQGCASRPNSTRPFVTAPYVVRGGRVVATIPKQGPCFSHDSPCCIVRHGHRRRKVGIGWGSVAVVRCATHGQAFTLYPPGHVPYGREPWIDVAPDGSLFQREEADRPGTQHMTPLSSALDVASEGDDLPAKSRSTRRRHLRRAAAVVGLLPTVPAHSEKVGGVTGLPGGSLFFASRRLAASSDARLWRAEVSAVFADLIRGTGRALMDRLAVLGHIVGLWGPPYRWRENRAILLALGEPFWRVAPAPI